MYAWNANFCCTHTGSERGLRHGAEVIHGFSMVRLRELRPLFQAAVVSSNLAVRLNRPHALALR